MIISSDFITDILQIQKKVYVAKEGVSYCSHLLFMCSNEFNFKPDHDPLNFRRYRKTANVLFSSVNFQENVIYVFLFHLIRFFD